MNYFERKRFIARQRKQNILGLVDEFKAHVESALDCDLETDHENDFDFLKICADTFEEFMQHEHEEKA